MHGASPCRAYVLFLNHFYFACFHSPMQPDTCSESYAAICVHLWHFGPSRRPCTLYVCRGHPLVSQHYTLCIPTHLCQVLCRSDPCSTRYALRQPLGHPTPLIPKIRRQMCIVLLFPRWAEKRFRTLLPLVHAPFTFHSFPLLGMILSPSVHVWWYCGSLGPPAGA